MLREYVKGRESVRYSVSATTRAPRPGEENGKDYYFLTKEEFLNRVEQGNILEYAQYNGNFYGTPKDMVEQALAQGQDIILEIDVQGALQVKEKSPGALLVFILPPSGDAPHPGGAAPAAYRPPNRGRSHHKQTPGHCTGRNGTGTGIPVRCGKRQPGPGRSPV